MHVLRERTLLRRVLRLLLVGHARRLAENSRIQQTPPSFLCLP